MTSSPQIIGIAGASCSGKTTLARLLAAALPGENLVLSLDAYYRDFASLQPAAQARFNFDAPEALDFELLCEHLEALSRGAAVQRPIYRFDTHSRASHQGEWVEPGAHVIVEGLFALYWPHPRRLYRVSIFVQADEALCLERRLARDLAERGRTRESVLRQYHTQVAPMSRQYLLPTRAYADLAVDGAAPVEESGRQILDRLDRLPPQPGEFRVTEGIV